MLCLHGTQYARRFPAQSEDICRLDERSGYHAQLHGVTTVDGTDRQGKTTCCSAGASIQREGGHDHPLVRQRLVSHGDLPDEAKAPPNVRTDASGPEVCPPELMSRRHQPH